MSININPDYNKTDIWPLTEPDEYFNSLESVHYIYAGGCPCNKRHISLIPSMRAFPSKSAGYTTLSSEVGIRIIRKDDPYMRVSEQELISVLWAKVGQLDRRVEELTTIIANLQNPA